MTRAGGASPPVHAAGARSRVAVALLCLTILAPVGDASAASGRCAALDVRGELTCSSVIRDEITGSTPNRLTGPYICPRTLSQAGGEHVYTFVCQKNGRVKLLIDQLQCDLDIYVLGDTCDTVRDCKGESVAGSNTRDAVSFQCRMGETYFILVEGYGYQHRACKPGKGTYRLSFDVSDETGGCVENCRDGRDNDRDSLVDCDDPDCEDEEECTPPLGDIGFDTSGLPDHCYAGRECAGEVKLLLPDDPTLAEALEGAIRDPATRVWLEDEGERVELTPAGEHRYAVATTYPAEGIRSWAIHVDLPEGEARVSDPHRLLLETPLELRAPPVLDFGSMRAGTSTLAPDHCVDLDLSASTGLEDHLFRLELAGIERGCESSPGLISEDRGGARPLELPLSGSALAGQERFCLRVPACAGDSAPDGALLRIVPATPEFVDEVAEVALRWEVESRPWLICNAWWLAIVAAALFAAWVIYGFIRPARFPAEASILVAGSIKGLRRAAEVPLRECRGSSAGFYRDARLGIHGDGSVSGRIRGALIRLRARRVGGLVLQGGHVERLDRRTRKWAAPDDLARGHAPDVSATYRVGETYFRLEGI